MLERFETGEERLVLRVLDEPDAYELLDFHIRNKIFFKPWMPEFESEFYTYEYQLNKIRFEKELRDKGSEFRFYIFKKDQPEKVIGYVIISNIVRGVFQCGFLGYSVDGNENGKGIATEAIRKMTEVSFIEIKLHRLEANVIPSNAASLRVLEKLNFVKEGFSKQYLKINNKWEDHIRFAIINNDFD